jgi:hypothetical protein
MKANPGERILAAEMVTTLVLTWIATVYRNSKNPAVTANPLDAAPKPQQFLAQIGAFGALSLLAMFGPQPERLAAGLGGLVTLVIVLKASGILFPNPKTGAAFNFSQPTTELV